MEIVSDEQVLAGCMVDTGADPNDASVGGFVSKVDAGYLIGAAVEDLDLGSTEVVIEELGVRNAAYTARLTG